MASSCDSATVSAQFRGYHWIGLRENPEDNPILAGKNHGFRFRFSLQPVLLRAFPVQKHLCWEDWEDSSMCRSIGMWRTGRHQPLPFPYETWWKTLAQILVNLGRFGASKSRWLICHGTWQLKSLMNGGFNGINIYIYINNDINRYSIYV